MLYTILTLIAAAAAVLAVLLPTKRGSAARSGIIKALVLLFCAIGFARQWMADSIYLVINGGSYLSVYYESQDVLQMILRWGYFSAYAVLPLAAFTKNRLFRNFAGYVTLPFAVLSAIYFNDFMAYFTDARASGFMLDAPLRAAYFILELALAIAIPLIIHISERHSFRFLSLVEWKNFILGAIGIAITSMPVYVPQSFLGYHQIKPDIFSTYHLIWIAVVLLAVIYLYHTFRFRPYADRYALCLFLAIILFFQYNSFYLTGITLKRLPFQLCNIASYFFLIATVFKLEKFFHFCFIANIVGTIIAIVGPDFGYGNAAFGNVHFIYEHSLVLILPAMLAGLRIFRRVTPRSLKYFLVGYTIYFLFCFVLGTIMNGYADVTGETVNYFYMFDLKTATDYFPFVTFATEIFYTFGRFTVYPVMVAIVYVGFFLLSILFYLFVRLLYRFEDDHLALRGAGIDLYEKITGRVSRRPKLFID